MKSFRWLLMLWGVIWLLNLLRGPGIEEEAPRRPRIDAASAQDDGPPVTLKPPSANAPRRGPALPPPSADDPVVLVEPDRKQGTSVGTAFAMHEDGVWVTARHVVNDCRRVAMRGRYGWSAIEVAWVHPRADLAIVRTQGAPAHLALSQDDVSYDQNGYAIGYPQAKPGAVHGHLLGRTRMRSPGLFAGESSTLAWAEVERQPGLSGSLGGISGGPLLDETGRVIAVIVAEVPRRGRFETLAPEVLRAVAARDELWPSSRQAPLQLPLHENDFGRTGEELRQRSSVALVGCSA